MAHRLAPSPAGPLIPPREHPTLARLARYFGWRRLAVEWRGTPRHDISVAPGVNGTAPTVYVGPRWIRRGRPLKALAHEGIHGAGLEHGEYARARGYYSKDRRKDTLTDRVYADALAGTAHFDPRRFGLDPLRFPLLYRRPR